MTDLELAVETLKEKTRAYDIAWSYYNGPQPIVYSTEKLENIFTRIKARFTNNFIALAVDAVVERLELQEFKVMAGENDNEPVTQRLNNIWSELELDGDEEDIETALLVTSEAYVVVWRDEELQAFYNDPRMCHVFYEADNPKKKRFAAKWWQEQDKTYRLTLYYPDRVEYYQTTKKVEPGMGVSAKAFKPTEEATADNPFGFIPVVHFRLNGRDSHSAILNLIEPQDAYNKLLNDMMISSEFGAFPQRYIISNADTADLKNSPNEIWNIPAGDGQGQETSVGQFPASTPQPYIDALETQAAYIALEAKLPKHYLQKTGGDPSGEALIAMEAPLNKKCQRIIDKRLAPAYRELATMLLSMDGLEVAKSDIVPVFSSVETVQPVTQAQIFDTLASKGTTEAAAEIAGYTADQVAKLTRADFLNGDNPR